MMLLDFAMGPLCFVEGIHPAQLDMKWSRTDQFVQPFENLATGRPIVSEPRDTFRNFRHRLHAVGVRHATTAFHEGERLLEAAAVDEHMRRIDASLSAKVARG